MIHLSDKIRPASCALRAAARSSSAAALIWLSLGGGFVFAQANAIEEGGLVEKRVEPAPIDDKAFDCAAFRKLIAAASDGFKGVRSAVKAESDSLATFGVTDPLFGACEIVDKKKIGEIIYSCQAEKLSLADLKATVEACLGDKAFSYAGNENPNTPFLRYSPKIGDARARVVVLTTFGKKTLAIMNPR
ncbi:hypothetical protein QM467_03660 [Rhodoblastus sp. 17X3]|uniref:hypothetical protein n=1 Tax=Rhodoblastus sp. 17X3 TaxID=3047026 RepID=UPI0024B7E0F7|nr:hypothetical protein [Rhodoblastus sp. 17X3]MDI9847156.1 hypothetical protein [Rhodoblastus sp. 17X3]